jgi:hypothetical protein
MRSGLAQAGGLTEIERAGAGSRGVLLVIVQV